MGTHTAFPLSIPSPEQGVWHLGPLPLRAYAVAILLGIFAAYIIGKRRWVARGGAPEVPGDVVMWAVPFGLVGSRIYHVATDYHLYFGEGKDPVDALKIWNGGLGVWGAIGFGALGAWIACRRAGVPFLAMADAMAPGLAVAQAIGRWGNYFNQELFGRPTTLPWGLEIDISKRPEGYAQFETFHPTFLYECIWTLGVAALVILADRRFRFGHGRALAVYVAGYCAGRVWIEALRIDSVNEIAGLRLNIWTSIILFVAAVAYFVISRRRHPGREDLTAAPAEEPSGTPDAEPATASDEGPSGTPDAEPATASDEVPPGSLDAEPATVSADESSGTPDAEPVAATASDEEPDSDSEAAGDHENGPADQPEPEVPAAEPEPSDAATTDGRRG